MNLKDLIERLQAIPADTVFPNGFGVADSWRGAYEQVAFEPATNTRAGDMLAEALHAVGTTYQGYKGGDYTMRPGTDVHIAAYGCYGGEDDALTTWRWKWMLHEAGIAA